MQPISISDKSVTVARLTFQLARGVQFDLVALGGAIICTAFFVPTFARYLFASQHTSTDSVYLVKRQPLAIQATIIGKKLDVH